MSEVKVEAIVNLEDVPAKDLLNMVSWYILNTNKYSQSDLKVLKKRIEIALTG